MRATVVLGLTLSIGCGGGYRYLVPNDGHLADPVVAAVREDGALVGLRKGTFAPTADPTPPGTFIVKGRGTKHPYTKAGVILIGAGLALGVGFSAAMMFGAFSFCGNITEGGQCDSRGIAGITFGSLAAAVGDSMWITGIIMAGVAGTRGPDVTAPPQSTAQTLPLAGFRF